MFRKLIAALVIVFGSFGATSAYANQYAAIAYSESTGNVGYTWNYCDLGAAEIAAIDQCNSTDAVIVSWSQNEWCALAVSDDGSYGYSSGETQEEAETNALANCTGNAQIVASVFSGCN